MIITKQLELLLPVFYCVWSFLDTSNDDFHLGYSLKKNGNLKTHREDQEEFESRGQGMSLTLGKGDVCVHVHSHGHSSGMGRNVAQGSAGSTDDMLMARI